MTKFNVPIRVAPFAAEDGPGIAAVFFDAVQIGAAGHYGQPERDAWCGTRPSDDWAAHRLAGQAAWVAHAAEPIGFMSLDRKGHLDMAFVAPAFEGQGVARQLYARIEAQARDWGLTEIETYASHVARPVFEAWGWDVIRANTVEKGSVTLENWFMVKQLRPQTDRRDE